MRGVRIQSIVKELNDEKIDVIEWNPDPAGFIAKALSPARVSGVYLDDDPGEGRTAAVIVPDDQLSLAIGREGQNARLAAKLTPGGSTSRA
jgi:N utilization substance protein A